MASGYPSASVSSGGARRAVACCLSFATLLGTLTPSLSASADDSAVAAPAAVDSASLELKNRCADAYEATQRERAVGHLLVARTAGIFCAQSSCPDVLREDCAKWAAELGASIPSLVVEARGPSGELLSDVRVQADGALFSEHLDGRSREVDPGRHHFRFEAAGFVPVDRELVVLEGHEIQHLSVTLELEPRSPRPRPGLPAASFALAGVGALGLASFAYFGLSGNHKKNELSSCAPACDPAQRAPIQHDYLAADVSLGVSLVSLGVSAWLALASQRPPKDPALEVRAGSQGALLSYKRGF
jgi:hypothetical protein